MLITSKPTGASELTAKAFFLTGVVAYRIAIDVVTLVACVALTIVPETGIHWPLQCRRADYMTSGLVHRNDEAVRRQRIG